MRNGEINDADSYGLCDLPDVGLKEHVMAKDRWLAALAHLGVPMYSVFLPLIVWATSTGSPLRRAHARQAFSFQCIFLVGWVPLVALMAVGALAPSTLVGVLLVAFALELPQVQRALAGRPPFRLLPVELLPA